MSAALYLDADVPPDLARVLRAHGHDVVSTLEHGRLGEPDDSQLAYAAVHGRAILTFNYPDFLRLGREWCFAGRPHAGIVISYRQYRRAQLGELARLVLALLNGVAAEHLANTIRVLDQFG